MLDESQEIQTIRQALKLIPDLTERQAALEALQAVAATLEVQGIRILQLNGMVPLDEVGHPATQAYVDALLKRPQV